MLAVTPVATLLESVNKGCRTLTSRPSHVALPGLVALALALARGIDDVNFASSHPALTRELRATLAELHKGAASGGGKLALVVAKSAPRH
jgi:hypothetical protein